MDMFEDFRFKIFEAVVREESFTKAAESLGISQPAVSQSIAELEKMAGIRLFDRMRRSVVLTAEGEVFSNYVKGITSSYVEMSELFMPTDETSIKIAVPDDVFELFISPALEDFVKVHPDVTFVRTSESEPFDLKISLNRNPRYPFEQHPDAILRVRLAVSPLSVQKDMGDMIATHESSRYFDLLYQPSEIFAVTSISAVLKKFLSRLTF